MDWFVKVEHKTHNPDRLKDGDTGKIPWTCFFCRMYDNFCKYIPGVPTFCVMGEKWTKPNKLFK